MNKNQIFQNFNLDYDSNNLDVTKNKYYSVKRVTKLSQDDYFSDEKKNELIKFLRDITGNKDPNDTEDDNENLMNNNTNTHIKDSISSKNVTNTDFRTISDEEFIKNISLKKKENYRSKMHKKIEKWCLQNKIEIDMIYKSTKQIFNNNKVIIGVPDSKLYTFFVQHLYFIYHDMIIT